MILSTRDNRRPSSPSFVYSGVRCSARIRVQPTVGLASPYTNNHEQFIGKFGEVMACFSDAITEYNTNGQLDERGIISLASNALFLFRRNECERVGCDSDGTRRTGWLFLGSARGMGEPSGLPGTIMPPGVPSRYRLSTSRRARSPSETKKKEGEAHAHRSHSRSSRSLIGPVATDSHPSRHPIQLEYGATCTGALIKIHSQPGPHAQSRK